MGESLRILIVEDSEDDALLMLAELKRGGYDPVFVRVDTPEDMSSALRDRVWDIVVSDYVMPRFSGLAALKLLQETGLDLPFILVSGHIGEDIAVNAMRAGAHDYILKGNYSRLAPAISRELREAANRSEKALSEQALRESEERFRSLFENMLDGYAYCEGIIDNGRLVDFVYLAVNSAFQRLTGLENVIGKRVSEVIPGLKESNPGLFDTYGRAILSGFPEKFEEYIEPLGICLSISVYSTGNQHFVAVFDNITERKQAEEALRESEQRLDMAQNAANIGVWDWNLLNGSIEWSTRMFDLFGLDPSIDTASLEVWKRIIHPEDIEIASTRIDQALTQRTKLNSDYRIVMPDGEVRWIYATGEGKYDDNGKPVRMIGVCTDITERKLTEAALSRAAERDRHIADVLQRTVMPTQALIQPDGYSIAARYQPALTEAEVCGDFCDIFELGDARIGIAIGDVVGKGLLGAVRVTAARNAIRCYAYLGNSPASVMSLVNEALCRDITTENDMLTAFFAVLDINTGKLSYSNAGHEPPLVRHSDGRFESLTTGGPMFIGMGSQTYVDDYVDLGVGDIFVMVTDGITEARNIGYAEQFGAEGITVSIAKNVCTSADQIAENLLEDASSFVNGSLRDDAAIVVIKVLSEPE